MVSKPIAFPAIGSNEFSRALQQSLASGVSYLQARQLTNGEFPTHAGIGLKMEDSHFYGSPFITTFVLYAMAKLNHPELVSMRKKALHFLFSEQQAGGIWRNHTRDNPFHQQHPLPADLDDISTVSFILNHHGIPYDTNLSLLERNRNSKGIFLTWIDPPFQNEVDAVVNANVLLYLDQDIGVVCDYINQTVLNDLPYSRWYPNKLSFYYMVSRAFENGRTPLLESKQYILDRIGKFRNNDGSFGNDLQSALAITTLINFGYAGPLLNESISFLLKRQKADGSWEKSPFFNGFSKYYGSDELTSALALEALHKYALYGL